MENGDNGVVSSTDNNAQIISVEQALALASEARDNYKARMESAETQTERLRNRMNSVKEILEEVIEAHDGTEDEVSISADDFMALCKHVGIDTTRSVTYTVTASGTVVIAVPLFGQKPDYHDIDVEASGSWSSSFDVEESNLSVDEFEEES